MKVPAASTGRWTEKQAWAWRKRVGWLTGCNFTPSNAINQLEFWQAETFSPQVIDRELGWAAELGFNSMRVFLHNLLWERDAIGFCKRIEQYLKIADKHGIGTLFVLFDSCSDPNPALGKQRPPIPHQHNSGWMQAPGVEVLKHPETFLPMQAYVEGVIGKFRNDDRIHGWDIWNEPDNGKFTDDAGKEVTKGEIILPFLIKAFAWARNARPSQPLTAAPWISDWSTDDKLTPVDWFLFNSSDVISFHVYADPKKSRERLKPLARFKRPILCTEYMARTVGSTFKGVLPIFHKAGVGAYNWGFVAGKTQTQYPWESTTKPFTAEPAVWFHEVLHPDGRPYDAKEAALIRKLTARSKPASSRASRR